MKAILRKKGKAVGCQPHIAFLMVPFALPIVALVLRPTLSATKLTVGFAHLIYISTIWRNYLFHLTYILYHSFYFLANYYCYEFLYIRAIIKQFLFYFLNLALPIPHRVEVSRLRDLGWLDSNQRMQESWCLRRELNSHYSCHLRTGKFYH